MICDCGGPYCPDPEDLLDDQFEDTDTDPDMDGANE